MDATLIIVDGDAELARANALVFAGPQVHTSCRVRNAIGSGSTQCAHSLSLLV